MSIDTSLIDVHVKSVYIPEQSKPEHNRYVFAYTVTIRNNGEKTTTLHRRNWVITDADGKQQTVQGIGVIGETPSIKPGEEFEYTSGAILQTPLGTMHGCYELFTHDGEQIGADIKPFLLSTRPSILH